MSYQESKAIRTELANDEEEIDLLELFRECKKHILIIILTTLVFGGAAGAFSKYVMVPQYSSTAMMYILSKETTLTSLADLQIGAQLTNDYQVIVKSRPVLQDAIDRLQLQQSYEQLSNRLTIGNPSNTRILTVSIEDSDPKLAKDIVDTVAKVSSDYIADTMEMVPPKIIEEGTVATQKTSPSVTKNTMIGALAGAVFVCAIIVIRFLLNDAVTTSEDVEKYLGISVLATVPIRRYSGKDNGADNGVKHKKSKRKK